MAPQLEILTEAKTRANAVVMAGKSVNLTALSSRVNVSVPHLSRILAGLCDPSISTARRLAPAFDLTVGQFIDLLETSKAA